MIGEQEKQAIIDLFPFMGEKPVVFDVGSNKGGFSDVILNEFLDDCELHLFEPNKKYLDYTAVKYEYRSNVLYNDKAAFSHDKGMRFFYFENFNNELSSFFKDKDWVKEGLPIKEKIVETTQIDTYCKANRVNKINYLKIDCEGSDLAVLRGCEELLQDGRVDIIQIEYSKHWERGKYEWYELRDIVVKNGYKIYRYVSGNFWEVTADSSFDNYYLTKYEIHNHSVGGWNSQFILNTMELPKFDLCLEIGAFEGMTTKYIHDNMLNDGGRVNVIDPLEDHYVEGDTEHPYFKDQYKRFKRNTRGLYINLYRDKSENILPTLNALRHDFVFIDGNHYGDHPYIDGVWAFAITKVGGYILFDDYTWRPETTAAIDKFLEEFNGFYDLITKDYQVLIRKVTNRYNEITQPYYL